MPVPGINVASEEHFGSPIIAFANAASLEGWLSAQPAGSKGLWINFAKKSLQIDTLTTAEAIDAALCYGWIDGQLDKFDEHHWLIRFTPRKGGSKWSLINRRRAMAAAWCRARMQSSTWSK